MSLFKAFRMSVNVLFLALDLLRRASNALAYPGLASDLLGPLCLSIACKYEQRSTFNLTDLIAGSPHLLPNRVRLLVSEVTLRDAEFTVLRHLQFTVRTASLQPHEVLYRQLNKPIDFIVAAETSKAQFSDAALFMLFQAYLDDRVRETP